jgi:hypothetical protein
MFILLNRIYIEGLKILNSSKEILKTAYLRQNDVIHFFIVLCFLGWVIYAYKNYPVSLEYLSNNISLLKERIEYTNEFLKKEHENFLTFSKQEQLKIGLNFIIKKIPDLSLSYISGFMKWFLMFTSWNEILLVITLVFIIYTYIYNKNLFYKIIWFLIKLAEIKFIYFSYITYIK